MEQLATAALGVSLALALAQRDLSDHGRGWLSGMAWVFPVLLLIVITFVYVFRRIRTRDRGRGLGPPGPPRRR